jgi:hypothetical protein
MIKVDTIYLVEIPSIVALKVPAKTCVVHGAGRLTFTPLSVPLTDAMLSIPACKLIVITSIAIKIDNMFVFIVLLLHIRFGVIVQE